MNKPLTLALAAAVALTAACTPVEEQPPAVQPAATEGGKAAAGKAPSSKAAATPIKLTAKRVAYPKQEFATGGPYSCVKAVITNQKKSALDVNPFFFAITGTDGEKRKGEVGAAEGEFETLSLAPGEKASGVVCAETKVPAKLVTFSDGLDEVARAEVG